jgi:hypothetical protein
MKHRRHYLRKLNQDTHAGIATYVLIMFGLAFMLYLFGFTSIYDQWSHNSNINGSTDQNPNSISDPNLNQGGFIETLMNPLNLLTAGAIGATGLFIIIGWFTKSTSTVLQYAIPAIILIALNIFVFPINTITDEMGTFNSNAFPIAGFILILFNLFYILSVIDFIRGPT